MKNKVNIIRTTTFLLVSMIMSFTFTSCEDQFDFELPDSNSKADTVLPSANFTYIADIDDFKKIYFSDLSSESTMYLWDFGSGVTSTEQDPTYTFEAGEGTYPVTLTTSDANGASDTITLDVVVFEPEEPLAIIPVILEPSFEDNTLPDGSGDGRDSWRNSNLGGVIQINTSSSVPDGGQAAKFPGAGDRIGYQEIEVSPNTDYVISYSYRLEAAGGSCTVAILAGGGFTTQAETDAAIIQSFTGSAEAYTPVNILFNSGANSTVSIYITNQGEEARVDNFTADLQ